MPFCCKQNTHFLKKDYWIHNNLLLLRIFSNIKNIIEGGRLAISFASFFFFLLNEVKRFSIVFEPPFLGGLYKYWVSTKNQTLEMQLWIVQTIVLIMELLNPDSEDKWYKWWGGSWGCMIRVSKAVMVEEENSRVKGITAKPDKPW